MATGSLEQIHSLEPNFVFNIVIRFFADILDKLCEYLRLDETAGYEGSAHVTMATIQSTTQSG